MEIPKIDFSILPVFPNINASFVVSPTVMTIVLVLFFIVYAIISGILVYHWSAYGMRSRGIIVAESLFLFVSLVLFTVAGTVITYF